MSAPLTSPSPSIPLSPTGLLDAGRSRMVALDILRGAIMALMALDHVRIFLSNATVDPTDLSQTSSALFLTRWVTHYCAPGFVFLAGVGAGLHAQRPEDRGGISRYLLTRGAWLILLEFTLARFGWTFNLDYGNYLLAGVLWCIGWSMIVLAGLARLPKAWIAACALAVIFGHNLLDYILPALAPALNASPLRWLWQVLYLGGPIAIPGGPRLFVLYSILPWAGVMAAGYAFAPLLRSGPAVQTRACLALGAAALLLFVVLRGANSYGDALPWSDQSSPLFTIWSFVNTRKYPASLLFLLMTIGPLLLLIPLLHNARNWPCRLLATIGRVPLFYYLLHLPLIHLAALTLSLARYGEIAPWLTRNHPIAAGHPPEDWGIGLPGVYGVTAVVLALLYWPCAWFARIKERSRSAWLSYL